MMFFKNSHFRMKFQNRHRFQCTMCVSAMGSVEDLQRHMHEAHGNQLLAVRQAAAAAAAAQQHQNQMKPPPPTGHQKFVTSQMSPQQQQQLARNGDSAVHVNGTTNYAMMPGGLGGGFSGNGQQVSHALVQHQQQVPPLSNFSSPKSHFVSPKQQILVTISVDL